MPLERLPPLVLVPEVPTNHLIQNSQGHNVRNIGKNPAGVQAAAMLPCDPQNTKALQENAEPKLRIHKVS